MADSLIALCRDLLALIGGLAVRLLVGAGAMALLVLPALALVLAWMVITRLRHGLRRRHSHHAG